MKNINLFIALFATIFAFSQKKHTQKTEFTAVQKTQLIVKKLSITLDLSEKQTAQIIPLMSAKVQQHEMKKAERESHKEISTDEKFKLAMAHLNDQASLRREMKKILDKNQYEKWTEMHRKHEQKPKRGHAKKGEARKKRSKKQA